MKGMNANTGRSISGLNHFYQSIGKIVTTPLASCV
ncbi:MAG: baseplate assembly protein, partial [Burkholderia sp.]|nr:baseplate assembly protein [Burkholderia sp.]